MTPDKELYYEHATRKLLKTIDAMNLGKLPSMRAKNLILLFRDSFKLPTVKYKTFEHELGDSLAFLKYDSDGFCRVASTNFGIMMGGAERWQMMYIDDKWTYGPHHFLTHVPTNTILDLTYDQYTNHNIKIPYDIAHPISYQLDTPKTDPVMRFAAAMGIDLIGELKKQND